jgi:D-inositol-3-phosphate glycosyltransferase
MLRTLAPRLRDAGHQVDLITQHTPHPLAPKGIQVLTLPRTDDLDRHRQAVQATLVALHSDVVESSSWEAETFQYTRRPVTQRAPVLVRSDLSAATMRAFGHLVPDGTTYYGGCAGRFHMRYYFGNTTLVV